MQQYMVFGLNRIFVILLVLMDAILNFYQWLHILT